MNGEGRRSGVEAELRNEFAAVRLSIDTTANGPRLRIQDLETDHTACVDAFVLRSLALLPPEALVTLCRWTVPVEPTASTDAGR